jgi:serine/threonine-protein kinase
MSDQDPFRIEGSVQAGTFRVERAVAEGGFAVVYRAYHTAFRAPVALKCLKVPSSLSGAHQAAFLEQFRAEAEVLFRLSARIPTVVRPLHAGTLEGASVAFVPYLAMEWLEGATLEELLEQRMRDGRGPFSLDELTRLLMPAAEGLHQAHSFAAADGTLSVLHRDLKPANLFIATIDGKRIPKVLDSESRR